MPGTGWGTAQGTSMSVPLFAALVADAAQLAGHRIGVLGPALYTLHGPGRRDHGHHFRH